MFFRVWLTSFSVIFGSNQLDKLYSLLFVTIVHIKFHHHKPSWGPLNGGGGRMPLAPYKEEHCQRHNGPKDWVLLTKVTSLGYITSSYTNLLDQASTSKSQPNISILTRPTFRISTKIRLHNLNQASAAQYWPNFSFRSNQIPPELKLKNCDQTLCSKSEQKFSFMTKLQLLHQHDSQHHEKQQYKKNLNKFGGGNLGCG